jgi:hypothetical protein
MFDPAKFGGAVDGVRRQRRVVLDDDTVRAGRRRTDQVGLDGCYARWFARGGGG